MPPTALVLNAPSGGWVHAAECANQWNVMEAPRYQDVPYAKQICHACPVEYECRAWALSLPPGADVVGVCGGMTAEERAKARRRARRTPKADPAEPSKTCTTCKAAKPLSAFYPDARNRDGRGGRCRACHQDVVLKAQRGDSRDEQAARRAVLVDTLTPASTKGTR